MPLAVRLAADIRHSDETDRVDYIMKLTDQDGTEVTVSWTLTVGTANWLFIATDGNDSTGTGAIDAPFLTTDALHEDDYSIDGASAGKLVYYREGTYNLRGMSNSSNNYRMKDGHVSTVHLGYPGESVVLHMDEGHFFSDGEPDVFIGDMTLEHDDIGYVEQQKMFLFIAGSHRCSMFNCIIKDYLRNALGSGENAAVWACIASSEVNYGAFSHNTITGRAGTTVTTYDLHNSVIEENSFTGIDDFTQFTSANPSAIFLKDDVINISVRRNNCLNNTSYPGDRASEDTVYSSYYQDGLDSVECSYNTFYSTNTGTRGCWLDGRFLANYTVDKYYFYRNSISSRWYFGVAAPTTTNCEHAYNILQTGAMPTDDDLVNISNLDQDTYLDANMKLTGAHRTNYLGTHGAEIKPVYR